MNSIASLLRVAVLCVDHRAGRDLQLMSSGSDSREMTKGEIIRKFGFLLSDSKMLTRGNRLSYTVSAHPGIKA
jgi:hypothetical protein